MHALFNRFLLPAVGLALLVTPSPYATAFPDGSGGSRSAQDTPAPAQESARAEQSEATESADPELIKKLEGYLTQAKLKGRFTILGRDFQPRAEEYTIVEAKKMAEGDYWSLKARIKYGDTDQVFPLVLQIKWADKTPVITLERMTIPGLGTFSARVLFNNGMYAGTWQHDEVKGHLFGEVTPAEKAETETKNPELP